MARPLVWALSFALLGCSAQPSLLVQLVSNMAVSREIDSAHVEVAREDGTLVRSVDTPLVRAPARPTRIAAFSDLGAGSYLVTVELRRGTDTVQTRHVARRVDGSTIVTVLMTRDCNGVMCPSSDPSAVECLGGRCVPPTCDEEHPELCPAPECTSDAQCGAGPFACAPRACSASGTCFVRPDDALCGAPDEICDIDFGCEPSGLDAGAPQDAAAPVDAAVPSDTGVRCDPTQPFGPRTLVSELDMPDGLTLRLRADELVGLFWSSLTGTGDVFVASRATRDASFLVSSVSGLNTASSVEGDPAVSAEGTRVVIASTRDGSFDLFEASPTNATLSVFTTFSPLTALNSAGAENQPFLTASALYFSSDRSGRREIYRSAIQGNGFGVPEVVLELSSGTNEYDAALTTDERVIYFRSDRSGGPGGGDVYRATRASVGDPFGTPTLVAELSTPSIDGPSWVSDDECVIYLTSDVSGTPEIYVARRP